MYVDFYDRKFKADIKFYITWHLSKIIAEIFYLGKP